MGTDAEAGPTGRDCLSSLVSSKIIFILFLWLAFLEIWGHLTSWLVLFVQ